jgi:cytidine deaminase
MPDRLLKEAARVRERAYVPYSGYRVGAALEVADGTVFVGCNVENASLGLTICAERSVVAAAVAAGHREFRRLALSVEQGDPPAPCGACRQVLAEFAPSLQVVSESSGVYREWSLEALLPERFHFETDESPRKSV